VLDGYLVYTLFFAKDKTVCCLAGSFFLKFVESALLNVSLNPLTLNGHYSGRTAPLTSRHCISIFFQKISLLNILKMLHNLRFFLSSKCCLFHNVTLFGSCIIHILNTGVLKFKRKFQHQRVKEYSVY
jgi:hypothetical protein